MYFHSADELFNLLNSSQSPDALTKLINAIQSGSVPLYPTDSEQAKQLRACLTVYYHKKNNGLSTPELDLQVEKLQAYAQNFTEQLETINEIADNIIELSYMNKSSNISNISSSASVSTASPSSTKKILGKMASTDKTSSYTEYSKVEKGLELYDNLSKRENQKQKALPPAELPALQKITCSYFW